MDIDDISCTIVKFRPIFLLSVLNATLKLPSPSTSPLTYSKFIGCAPWVNLSFFSRGSMEGNVPYLSSN